MKEKTYKILHVIISLLMLLPLITLIPYYLKESITASNEKMYDFIYTAAYIAFISLSIGLFLLSFIEYLSFYDVYFSYERKVKLGVLVFAFINATLSPFALINVLATSTYETGILLGIVLTGAELIAYRYISLKQVMKISFFDAI